MAPASRVRQALLAACHTPSRTSSLVPPPHTAHIVVPSAFGFQKAATRVPELELVYTLVSATPPSVALERVKYHVRRAVHSHSIAFLLKILECTMRWTTWRATSTRPYQGG
jgi:hypothetical protein